MLAFLLAFSLPAKTEPPRLGGGGVDQLPPTLSLESISQGDTSLTLKADEPVTLAVVDDAALLAGVQVYRTPFGGTRGTDNIATAASFADNTITVTINTKAEQGDEFFVQVNADIVQNTAGNKNTAITGANELSFKLSAPTDQFIVAELPRSTNTLNDGKEIDTGFVYDNYRTHFVTFSIRTGAAEEGEYRLGLKTSTATPPTATELTTATAAITRTISATAINIYLPFHIEGSYFDDGATQDYATARTTTLDPETGYTLYATKADASGEVVKLLDFTTDAPPTDENLDSRVIYGMPSDDYTYTLKGGEQPFLVMVKAPKYFFGSVTFEKYQEDQENEEGKYVSIAFCLSKFCTKYDESNIIASNPWDTTILSSYESSTTSSLKIDTGGSGALFEVPFTTQPTP